MKYLLYFFLALILLNPFALQAQKIEQMIEEAESVQDDEERASLLLKVGKVYESQEDYSKALRYYLQCESYYTKQGNQNNIFQIHKAIANLYQRWDLHEKALKYYQFALDNPNIKNNEAEQVTIWEKITRSNLELKNYEVAQALCQKKLTYYRSKNDTSNILATLNMMSDIHKIKNEHEKALPYNNEILEINKKQGNKEGIVRALNNIGFLYRYLDKYQDALKYFNESLQQSKELGNEQEYTAMLINIGVMHQYLKDYQQSLKHLQQAEKIREADKDTLGLIQAYNYIANVYILMQEHDLAKKYTDNAIALSKKSGHKEQLMVSTERLSTILTDMQDYQNALTKYKDYVSLNNELRDELLEQNKQLTEREGKVANIEKEIELLLIDKAIKELELKKAQLENEKKTQTLNLALKEKELQNVTLKQKSLEQERAVQTLLLSQQKLEAEQKSKQILLLEQDKEIKDLAIKQQEAETQKQKEIAEKQKEVAEKQKELAEKQRLIKEQQQKFGLGIIGLVLVVLGLVLMGLYQSNKARRILKAKNAKIEKQGQEIMTQNEELQQNQEEIMAQRDFIEEKNTALSMMNEQMSQSISYASQIQKAILPRIDNMKKNISDIFMINIPKDVVSGDFYWFRKVDKYLFFAAVDCTGHGVPGAFMSMIGNTLLNEIINEKHTFNTDEILERLHSGITKELRQKETGNMDGMDVALCRIEPQENGQYHVVFSGAKRPLLFLKQGKLDELKGDRRHIGGVQQTIFEKFSVQELLLQKGDCLYLFSDGITDAADRQRLKFGAKRLKNLILENQNKDFELQHSILESTLKEFQGNVPQRDDILFMAVKL